MMEYEISEISDPELKNLPDGAYRLRGSDEDSVYIKINGFTYSANINPNLTNVYIIEKRKSYGVLPDGRVEELGIEELSKLLPVTGYGKGIDTFKSFVNIHGGNVNLDKLIQVGNNEISILDLKSNEIIKDPKEVAKLLYELGIYPLHFSQEYKTK